MKKTKKLGLLISGCLCFSVILGNLGLPFFAYGNDSTNIERDGAEPKEVEISLVIGASLVKEKIESQKTQQTSGKKINYVEGEVLVKYRNNKIDLQTVSGRAAALDLGAAPAGRRGDLIKNNIAVLKTKDAETVEQKVAQLRSDPNVEYAQPNYQYYSMAIDTNDTGRAQLWALENTGQLIEGTASSGGSATGTVDADIDAPEAWAINEGTSTVPIVAVIDTGVAYQHPDLLANMWDGSSCKDEDGNSLGGCNYGYDFQDDDKMPLPTTSAHGTRVAGSIAAVKNNGKGVIGVAPRAKIMAIKSSLTTSNIIESIDFATQNGATIINASWGGSTHDDLLEAAIAAFPGLFVTAAGNDSTNNESVHLYPSDYDAANIISVAATDQNDAIADFSNYGAVSVDVAAPGVNIYSIVSQETTVMSEDFETVATSSIPAGWTAGGTGNNWGVYDTGVENWDNVLYSDLNTPYLDNASTTVTSPTYDLSGGGANIDFWSACDTEYNTLNWDDYMALDFSSDGSNFTEVLKWDEVYMDDLNGDDDQAGSAQYHFEHLSIPSIYATSNFKFRLRWTTEGDNNDYNGCLIDSLEITKYTDGTEEAYDYYKGTSAAAPYVAGLAALIRGYNPDLTTAQIKNIILTSGDSIADLNPVTGTHPINTGKRINAQKALQAANSDKAITAFTIPGQTGETVIDEPNHTITLNFPFGTDPDALVATFTTTGASVKIGATVQESGTTTNDFSAPVIYRVTAVDESYQDYTVTVVVAPDPDIALLAADKAALVENSIKGGNSALSNVTEALAVLPANGSVNASTTITWASSVPGAVSHDGQTVVRPAFAAGNTSVNLTATLAKGSQTDTKIFALTVTKLPASSVATVTSATYTVATTTISNVPFGTAKSVFLAALAKGQADQTWNSDDVSDPVATDDTLVVTAQNGTTTTNYVVTVNGAIQLTISAPTLTTAKPYDGGTVAAVTAGSLIGIVGGDVVTVTAVANYDTSDVGTAKTITVIYTLAGADAGKYAKPVNDSSVTSGVITAVVINAAAIAGATAPVRAAVPATTITATNQWTGAISWAPVASQFAASTVYTATITITPKTGYTLTGVTANLFIVSGATATNAADSGVVMAVFPATASESSGSGGGGGGGGTVTTFSGGTGSVGNAGGVVTLNPGDGTLAKLTAPANAFSSAATVTVAKVSNSSPTYIPPAGSTGLFMVGTSAYQITAVSGTTNVTSFAAPVALAFTYTAAQIPAGVAEKDLKVYYYDEATKAWVEVPSTVNAATHTITATVSHLTQFAIYGKKTPASTAASIAQLQALLNSLIAQLRVAVKQMIAQGKPVSPALMIYAKDAPAVVPGKITRGWAYKSSGDEIKIIQAILARDAAVYPQAKITGYFDAATLAGVRRFQKKYGISKPGDIGYGYVGPATRAKMNAM